MTGFKHPMTRVGDRLFNLARFNNYLVTTNTGCQEWRGSVNNCGYGLIYCFDLTLNKRKMMTVHRLALMIKLGRELIPGLNANHTCHNRLCCEPGHLVEGTQTEKMHDLATCGRIKLGRTPGAPGTYSHKQKNRQYRYTDDEIRWYRSASLEDIVKLRNCDRSAASRTRAAFRTGFRWLPTDEIYVKETPGRRKKI